AVYKQLQQFTRTFQKWLQVPDATRYLMNKDASHQPSQRRCSSCKAPAGTADMTHPFHSILHPGQEEKMVTTKALDTQGKASKPRQSSGKTRKAEPQMAEPYMSLTEKAYLALEEMIVTLKLPPGATVSETGLSMMLGIGRTPIREALHRLA